MKTLLATSALVLTACATLTPDAVRLEAQHTSHLSQHFHAPYPLSGYEALMLDFHWDHDMFHMDFREGFNLSQRDSCCIEAFGGLAGPQEVTQLSLAVDIWSKK